jgi:RimJ/RimL family protein N-acetyltransferase
MYEGALVRLREMRQEDAEHFVRWMNSPETSDLIAGGLMPMTLSQENDWIAANAGQRDERCNFAVETLDGKLIGMCSYQALDWKNRRCMVGWFLGDTDARGRGCGTDMIETLLGVCFQVLRLRKVRLNVFEFNNRAIRLYEKLGFRLEGVFRGERFARGQWWDELRYGMFQSEWAAQRGIEIERDEAQNGLD